jgi:hypothetical protein
MTQALPIVQEVYSQYIRNFGEPDRSIRFGSGKSAGGVPDPIDIFVWLPTPKVAVTSFSTIGMCGKPMPGADVRVEIQFAVRGLPAEGELEEASRFLANVAATPFIHKTHFDYLHTIPCAQVPMFQSCHALLFHPSLGDPGWNVIDTAQGKVKILQMFPITDHEYALQRTSGVKALLAHLERSDVDVFSRR